MNTSQLRAFLAVSDTLNFANAAKELHVTQPAVTQQIHSLEEELGVRLFRRSTRSVELTPEGLLFLNDARDILHIYSNAKDRLSKSEVKEWQFFKIGSHSYGEILLLSEILMKMKEEFPRLHPVFQTVPFQHLFHLLEENNTDVIVSFREIRNKKEIGNYMELARIPVSCHFHASFPLAGKQFLTPEDLSSYKLICIDPQKCPHGLSKINYRLLEKRSSYDVFFCESAEGAMALAKAQYGIAIFPELDCWNDKELLNLPLSNCEPLSYGIYYQDAASNPATKHFLDLAKKMWKQ